MKCIRIHTPQTYYEEKGIDIWDEIFDGAAFDNAALMKDILEHYYRKWMIGSCDADDWIEAVKDRLWIVGDRWDGIMTALSDADLSDIDVRSYERIVRRTAIEGTQGTVRTLSHSGDDVNVTENETLPQSPIDGRRYLDAKTTQTRTNGQTDTDVYDPNEKDHETYSEKADIAAQTYRDMMAKWPRLEEDFAAEFRDYFVNRWSACRPTAPQGSTPSRAPCPPGSIR